MDYTLDDMKKVKTMDGMVESLQFFARANIQEMLILRNVAELVAHQCFPRAQGCFFDAVVLTPCGPVVEALRRGGMVVTDVDLGKHVKLSWSDADMEAKNDLEPTRTILFGLIKLKQRVPLRDIALHLKRLSSSNNTATAKAVDILRDCLVPASNMARSVVIDTPSAAVSRVLETSGIVLVEFRNDRSELSWPAAL
jgi:hypothetical protein